MILHRNYYSLAILAILLLTALRLPGIATRSLEDNEIVTMLVAAGQSSPEFPRTYSSIDLAYNSVFASTPSYKTIASQLKEKDVHPPLYFWLLTQWKKIFGNHFIFLRAFSLFCFFFAALFFFLSLAKLNLERSLHHPILFFYGLSALNIFYSYNIRQYMFSILILNICLYLLLCARNTHFYRPYFLFLAGIFAGLGFFTNYLFLFIALAGGLFALTIGESFGKRIQSAIIFSIPFFIFLPIVWPFFLAQKNARPDQDFGYLGILQDLMAYANLFYQSVFLTIWHHIFIFLFAPILTALGLLGLKNLNSSKKDFLFVVLFLFIPLLGLMALNHFTNKHIYRYQSMALCSTSLLLLLAFGVQEIHRYNKKIAFAWIAVFSIVQLASLNWWKNQAAVDYRRGYTHNWAQDILSTLHQEKNLILVDRAEFRGTAAGVLLGLQELATSEEKEKITIAYWYSRKEPLPKFDFSQFQQVYFFSNDLAENENPENKIYFENFARLAQAQGFQEKASSSEWFRIYTNSGKPNFKP